MSDKTPELDAEDLEALSAEELPAREVMTAFDPGSSLGAPPLPDGIPLGPDIVVDPTGPSDAP